MSLNTYLYEFSAFSSKKWTTPWTPTEESFILMEEKWKSECKLMCFVSASPRLVNIYKILLYAMRILVTSIFSTIPTVL